MLIRNQQPLAYEKRGGVYLECLLELKEMKMWLIWHILISYQVPSRLTGS
jgi:hypothetical protein